MVSVLVVDDDDAIVRLVSLTVASEGYTVSSASDGEEGLAVLARSHPDMVILDVQMPVLDGRGFYRRARAMGYEGPVLICAADRAETIRRELGAEAAIEKPFDLDDLLSEVARLAPSA